jgi:hypothetical protein
MAAMAATAAAKLRHSNFGKTRLMFILSNPGAHVSQSVSTEFAGRAA